MIHLILKFIFYNCVYATLFWLWAFVCFAVFGFFGSHLAMFRITTASTPNFCQAWGDHLRCWRANQGLLHARQGCYLLYYCSSPILVLKRKVFVNFPQNSERYYVIVFENQRRKLWVYICMCVYICIHIYVCIYLHVYICVYIHIYIYVYIYIHTYIVYVIMGRWLIEIIYILLY